MIYWHGDYPRRGLIFSPRDGRTGVEAEMEVVQKETLNELEPNATESNSSSRVEDHLIMVQSKGVVLDLAAEILSEDQSNKESKVDKVEINENTCSDHIENNKDEHKAILENEIDKQLLSVIKNDGSSDSDVNNDDSSNNTEQMETQSNSQFYESSDSKVDFAIKSEDNDTLSDIEDIKTDTASADSEDSALGSLPSDPDPSSNEREEEGQDRSDGSDSGLGSETAEDVKASNFELELPSTESLESNDGTKDNISEPSNNSEETQCNSEESETDLKKPLKSSLKRKITDECEEEPSKKKKKQGIRFEKVRVYYFPRSQGFSCVPSQGGSTLGMEWKHSHLEDFTIVEHAVEQRRLHRQLLQQLKSERHSLQSVTLSSSEDSDTEEEASDLSESELDLDSYYFLQPVPTKQRRALLRAAGVRKIEGYEKDECRDIRTSREFCGCACKGACHPQTCSCSLAGIKCQVDRLNFPCGCTRDGCKNTTGRIEFNPIRVRTHFIHTLMRLGLEKKNEEALAAAKHQWASTVHVAAAPNISCVTNVSPFETGREVCPLRDVNQPPRVEAPVVIAENLNNPNCNLNSVLLPQNNNIQEQINCRYRCENANFRNVNEGHHRVESADLRTQVNSYTTNILQGKGPPYTSGNIVYDGMPHNVQRFPSDLTYYQQNEHHHFKQLQSFSASSFEEFVHNHNAHMSIFNNYGHVYPAEYLKPDPSVQYHLSPQNHYSMYGNNSEAVSDSKVDNYYAPMMSVPYQAANKGQSVENDENWFSQNTLMSLDHGEQTSQDTQEAPPSAAIVPVEIEPPAAPEVTTESTDNFGELIKKTMVESVSV